ncbi:retrovirus-related pol polyprotein from transposon TNT 1-94 [Tanacetum coccineum]
MESIKPAHIRSKEQCDDLINHVNLKFVEISDLTTSLQEKVLVITALKDELRKLKGKALANNVEEAAILRDIVAQKRNHKISNESLASACDKLVAVIPKNKDKRVRFTDPVTSSGNTNTKTASSSNLVSNKCMLSSTGVKLSTIASGSQSSDNTKKDKIQRTPSSTQKNKHSKLNAEFETPTLCVKVYYQFGNDHVAKILGYGDYQIGNITISRVYYMEGLGHNLLSIGQFCNSNLEVAFRQHTCFICNLEGVDLLTRSRGNNLYTLSLGDMMVSSLICLLSKATKTKSWLWHRRLSHLNFGAINHLARQGLVQSLPKLKFEKNHLCSAYAMGKSKKKPHKHKSKDTN